MDVRYLDADDEITVAIGRLRGSEDRQVVLVLQPGSRVATSRINFRLLAREAASREVTLGIVSGEAGVRALAISAGLLAYSSVPEAEASLGGADASTSIRPVTDPTPWVPPAAGASGLSASTAARLAAGQAPAAGPTPVAASAAPSAGESSTRQRAAEPRLREAPRAAVLAPENDAREGAAPRPRRRLLALGLVALLVLLLATGGAAAYFLLPTARITLTPRSTIAGPVSFEVVADPDRRAADPATGVVPAEEIEIPLAVSDEFPATGREVVETRARGTVRFRSENTLNDVSIPAGTQVTTASGVAFETRQSATITKASFDAGPTTLNVPVQAVEAGPGGNVTAGAIVEVPADLASALVSATNPQATSGGARSETALVSRSDYDAALGTLTGRLDSALGEALAAPGATPAGLVLFPETAQSGPPEPDPARSALVGQVGETFTLTVRSTATATAVDEAQLEGLAIVRLREDVEEGHQLFEDSIQTTVGAGEVDGRRIRYTIEAQAEQWLPPDTGALVELVRGRTVAEARAALSAFGEVQITIWPEFIDRLPDDDRRIELRAAEPTRSGSSPNAGSRERARRG